MRELGQKQREKRMAERRVEVRELELVLAVREEGEDAYDSALTAAGHTHDSLTARLRHLRSYFARCACF